MYGIHNKARILHICVHRQIRYQMESPQQHVFELVFHLWMVFGLIAILLLTVDLWLWDFKDLEFLGWAEFEFSLA